MDSNIYINFYGGTHGHFLEYVCNILFNENTEYNKLPFNGLGACHVFNDNTTELFYANHFYQDRIPDFKATQNNEIIISWDKDKDLLPLMLIHFLRAGDYELDPATMHEQFSDKIKNTLHCELIELISDSYQINLKELNDCPRHILREYFKFGFLNPSSSGYNQELDKLTNAAVEPVVVNFMSFYDLELFKGELSHIAFSLGFPAVKFTAQFYTAHAEFLSLQPYYNASKECDAVLSAIRDWQNIPIPPHFSTLYESYINAKLELEYKIEMPFQQDEYFKTTEEIIKYIDNYHKDVI